MAGDKTGQKHSKRFKKWQNLALPATRVLAQKLELELTPILFSAGFQPVDVALQRSDWPVTGSELRFERQRGDIIDYVEIAFAKYHRPRFQLHCGCGHQEEIRDSLRRANLVKRSSQYYHFWGKPWWVPLTFWTDRMAERTIKTVAAKVGQLVRFIEYGERGPNISCEFTPSHTPRPSCLTPAAH